MFYLKLTDIIFALLHSDWNDLNDFVKLDSAVCNSDDRVEWLNKMDSTISFMIPKKTLLFMKSNAYLWMLRKGGEIEKALCKFFSKYGIHQKYILQAFFLTHNSINTLTAVDLCTFPFVTIQILRTIGVLSPNLIEIKFDTPNVLSDDVDNNNTNLYFGALRRFSASHQSTKGILNFLKCQVLCSIESLSITNTITAPINGYDVGAPIKLDLEFCSTILTDCNSLTELNLENSWDLLTDTVLDHIVNCLPISIIELNLSVNGKFSDASLVTMCNALINLKKLKLNRCTNISLETVVGIVNGLPSLTHLEFWQWWCPASTAFQLLFDKFEEIYAMDIFSCSFVGFSKKGNETVHVSSFQLTELPKHTNDDKFYFLRLGDDLKAKFLTSPSCHFITDLTFANDVVDVDSLCEILCVYGARLTMLCLKSMNINFATMSVISQQCRSLISLSISKCSHHKDKWDLYQQSFQAFLIPQMDSIISLLIKTNPELKQLSLHGLKLLPDFAIVVGDSCLKLEVFKFTCGPILMSTITHIANKCLFLHTFHVCATNGSLKDAMLKKAFCRHPSLRICTYDNVYVENLNYDWEKVDESM